MNVFSKYLYKPKKSSVIIFGIIIFLLIVINVVFAIDTQFGNIPLTDESMILIYYLSLPALTICGLFMTVLYLTLTGETLFKHAGSTYLKKHPALLQVTTWIAFIIEIIFSAALMRGFFSADNYFDTTAPDQGLYLQVLNRTRESYYFRPLSHYQDLANTIAEIWAYLTCLLSLILGLVFLIFAIRKFFLKKLLTKAKEQEQQLTLQEDWLTQKIGFNYYHSSFYAQTGITYPCLAHHNGTRGEFEAYRQLVKHETEGAYLILNRGIPKEDGLNTEIDIIYIDSRGIVVIENKDLTGTVYGNAADNDWTIIDHGGRKISYYNPVKQNEGHILALKNYLIKNQLYIDQKSTPIYSVVVFTDTESNCSDNIISRINTEGTEAKICTSQNLDYIVQKLLEINNATAKIDTTSVSTLLMALPVFEKY